MEAKKQQKIESLRERREALKESISSGVLVISHKGKTITYRNMAEMKIALNMIEDELRNLLGIQNNKIYYARFRNE